MFAIIEIQKSLAAAKFIKNGHVNFKKAFRAGVSIESMSAAISCHLVKKMANDVEWMARTWSQHYDHYLAKANQWNLAPTADIGGTYTRWVRDIHAGVASTLSDYAAQVHGVDLETVMLDLVIEQQEQLLIHEQLHAIMEQMFATPVDTTEVFIVTIQ